MPGTGGERILIIDDNEEFCRTLVRIVGRMGMHARYETTLARGVKTARTTAFDIVFLDVHLPDGCGLDMIPRLQEVSFPPEIIIITGYGDEDGAETAIKNQAWDYIPKDTSFQNLKLSLTRAVQYRRQKRAIPRGVLHHRDGIVGGGPLISACLAQAAQAAASDGPVLIMGETGTGKEVFARAIHDNSARAAGDLVVVDCAALPGHLVESMLFGHKKGAFTSADADRIGLIEQAHKGTLFLDEVGELPGEVQKKFLRVLQEKRFRPLGAGREVDSDFRLVCATHRDLSAMAEAGDFRRDLYYRVRSMTITLPPLRQRLEDVPDLAGYQIKRHCRLFGGGPHRMSPDFIEALQKYPWPGNVRELFNTIDGVLAEASREPELFLRHLPMPLRTHVARLKVRDTDMPVGPSTPFSAQTAQSRLLPLKRHLDAERRQYIATLFKATRGDLVEACRISGLSRGHLYELLRKYQMRN